METLLQDIRYAARTLLKSPGFTVVAVLTLGLGIGAITTMFSVVNGVLLKPLAYQQPERLVQVAATARGVGAGGEQLSFPNFRDLRAGTRSFSQLGAFRYWLFNLSGQDGAEAVLGVYAGDGVFTALRVRPALGALLSPGADAPGPREALLSYGLWMRRYGGDPSLIGTSITVDGAPATVVGVLPRAFRFPELVPANTPLPSREPDIYMPVGVEPQIGDHDSRGSNNYWVIGRLAPGVTVTQSTTEVEAVAAHLKAAYPDNSGNLGLRTYGLKDQVIGEASRPLVILLGAVGLVLLIACANVGGLLLARAAGREREIAVRTALGASASRLARQMLTESVLLSVSGGLLGIALAAWGVQGLRAFAPSTLPRLADVNLDLRVLAFTILTSLVSGLFFGLWPILRRDRRTNEALREGGRHSWSRERRRVRTAIVVGEVALSIVLLTGAGLLLHSFTRLAAVNPGFEGKNVLTMFSLIPPARYPTPASWAAYERTVLDGLNTLPGVVEVGAVNTLPLSNLGNTTTVDIIDHPPKDMADMPLVGYRSIGGGYFAALKIPVVRGRAFGPQDTAGAPPVVVINETAARQFYPGENPLGRKIHLSNGDTVAQTIVGVIGDTHGEALDVAPVPEVSFPYQQGPQPLITLVIRTAGDPYGLAPAIRHELAAIDPQLPFYAVRTMDDLLVASLAQRRFDLELLAGFAGAALLLAALGLYGVIAYSVAQRTQEIGVRMALGAARRTVVGLVIRDGLWLTGAGLGIGLVFAALVSRVLQSQLYGVGTLDPVAYASVTLVFVAVALAASYIPARRAAGVDPIVALRTE
ncbi:MAG TPA: ABC transporter permease [Gemmatimonadales bacterium]|nr:ABC transporter permease [Gemmatimonadales bacterium]